MSSWMERTAILDADAIIAVSHGTKADILRAYPEVDSAKVHVIYNGIDLHEYQKTSATDALVEIRRGCAASHTSCSSAASRGRRALCIWSMR
jgi:glycosyltransferase involved in cell wall biosynthesis